MLPSSSPCSNYNFLHASTASDHALESFQKQRRGLEGTGSRTKYAYSFRLDRIHREFSFQEKFQMKFYI
ncbi:unnamed protein product [Coffea canephora]|uniref:Uncharacterized protein n=1 Tax=Coffea canephora TaxID=49390 RepID=A0A068UJY4_COFCA|nr:unnamed protein product [Coffea canephora]